MKSDKNLAVLGPIGPHRNYEWRDVPGHNVTTPTSSRVNPVGSGAEHQLEWHRLVVYLYVSAQFLSRLNPFSIRIRYILSGHMFDARDQYQSLYE